MDRRARAVLEAHGYELRALEGPGGPHRARGVRAGDLASRDLVLPMTAQHARVVQRLVPDMAGRVALYRTFDPAAPDVDPTGPEAYLLDIDDPWFGDGADFETCLAQIEAGADGVVRLAREEVARRAG
jgi:protein-tyrosine phosphatase